MKFGVQHWVILCTVVFLSQGKTLAHSLNLGNLVEPIHLAQAEPEAVVETEPVPTIPDTDRLTAIQRYNAGVDKLTTGDYQGAIAEFTAAIEIDPRDPDAFYNRAYSYHVLGQYEAAYADYGNAIQLNPTFADAYGNRCYAAYLLKNYEQALTDCDQAIILKDNNPDFFINRGNALDDLAVQAAANNNAELAQEYHTKAIADYDAAIKLKPDHAKAYYNRALTYNRLENHTAAAEDYSASIERDPQFAEAYFNRGITYYKLDDLEKAIADMRQAAEIFGQKNQTANQAQAIEIINSLQSEP